MTETEQGPGVTDAQSEEHGLLHLSSSPIYGSTGQRFVRSGRHASQMLTSCPR